MIKANEGAGLIRRLFSEDNMDIIQQGIITLIKSSITGEAYPLPEGFSLEEAVPQMKRHHIIPLCYDGAVRCGLPQNDPVMKQLFVGYCQALMKNEGQMREISRVCAAFDERGIDYMPLKGCNTKKLYPKPELRMMSDADILIRNEQRNEIEAVMESLGFNNTVNSDYEHVWKTAALNLELHRRLVPSYKSDLYSYLGDGWGLAEKKDGHCYAMSREHEYMYVFIHFLKHFREGGMGCRHITDLWVFLRSYPDLDLAYIEGELQKLSLLEFHRNIRQMIAVWFEDAPADERSEFITDYVFSSGSYGLESRLALTNALRKTQSEDGALYLKLRYFMQRLFPERRSMLYKFPILDRHPWMLPLVWIYRPFYKLLFERQDISKQQRLMKNMTQENLDSHRKALEYVGLDPRY